MSQIKQVKDATDIVEILGERIELQKAGTNFKANCPFHSEKTPSFFVNQQMQRFRCFGCGETGDVFEFLERYEGTTFYESLEMLADRANITLEKSNFQSKDDQQREQVLAALDLAKEYYHYLLTQHNVGQPARDYLKDRGTTKPTIDRFSLGYSLSGWDGLLKYLNGKKKYSIEVLEKAGLMIKGRSGRYYDRFRGRLMFPLKNHRGQVVGFSGRVLDPEVKEAKYINSPETMVYHKSEMLFGLSEQFQAIRKADEVVVVEGEFDVLSSVQAKLSQVVAIKGSAFTQEQARLLKRSVSKVILALDRDEAGIEATRRAITIANDHGLELRVADPQLLTGKDPDDLARENPKQWRQAVKQAISGYEFLIQSALDEFDQLTPEGKRQIMQRLAPVLDTIPHAVEQDFYLKKVADALNVRQDLVKKDITTVIQRQKLGNRPTKKTQSRTNAQETQPLSRKANLEEYALFLLLHGQPEKMPKQAERLKHITFHRPGVSQLIQTIQTSKKIQLDRLMKQSPEDTQQLVFELHLHPKYINQLDQLDIDNEWKNVVDQLINLDINQEIEDIARQLNKLDRKQDRTEEDEQHQQQLLQRIVTLRKRQTISKNPA